MCRWPVLSDDFRAAAAPGRRCRETRMRRAPAGVRSSYVTGLSRRSQIWGIRADSPFSLARARAIEPARFRRSFLPSMGDASAGAAGPGGATGDVRRQRRLTAWFTEAELEEIRLEPHGRRWRRPRAGEARHRHGRRRPGAGSR